MPRVELARQWCVGKGLEIGGSSHNSFPGLDTLNVDPFPNHPVFAGEQTKLVGWVLPVDIEAYADDIPVESDSQDFVISSHVLEHVANVIDTFFEWNRVVRTGGVIFMIVPHRDRTFDAGRERTTLQHLWDDYAKSVNEARPCTDRGHRH